MTYAATFARFAPTVRQSRTDLCQTACAVDGYLAGYTFDNDYDTFLDGDGNQWTPTSTADLNANDYVTVPF